MQRTSIKNRHRKMPTALSIAIIVRTKDRPQLLTRSLHSLAEQKRLPDEIIVVNDGGVAINNIVNKFSNLNIHLLNNEINQGRARAGNLGVQATTCDFIGFLDDDDRFLSDHLQRLEKALLHFDAKVAYSGCRLLQRDILGETVILQEQAIGQFNEPFDVNRLRYENYIPLINILINRELWLKIGGFDEAFDLFEDWDALLRLAAHANFYHLNRITTEYAVWGTAQITQATDKPRWKRAYQQFLTKHLIPLSTTEQLAFLADYWTVSQERRGIVQSSRQEMQTLQLQLIHKQQALEQVQAQKQQEINHLQQQLVQEQAQKQQEITQLQTQLNQVVAQYAAHTKTSQTQCDQLRNELLSCGKQISRLQRILGETEQLYQKAYQRGELLHERCETLYSSLHEVNQRLAVGINKAALEKILLSPMHAYALGTSSGQIIDDYHRLVDWIRHKTKQLVELEQQVIERIQPIRLAYQQVHTQATDLSQLISASRWAQVRRYAEAVKNIDNQVKQVVIDIEQCLTENAALSNRLQLNHLLDSSELQELNSFPSTSSGNGAVPLSRPLSDVYPTFVTVAGNAEQPSFMESVTELGTIPFMLDAGEVLVFTVYCTLNDFFRFDLLLATRLRINPCYIRVIIRELMTENPLRIIHIDALTVFDNRFHSVSFLPISDSAGKTYQIELDSPDANEQAGIAVWCHAKQPTIQQAQQLPEQIMPAMLPTWVQAGLLNLPLSSRFQENSAIYTFMIAGITLNTSILNLHVFLSHLGNSVENANSHGKIFICAQLSRELREYCVEQHLTMLPFSERVEGKSSLIPNLLDYAKTQATSDYIWCCNINTTPAVDIVERALEMWTECPDASLLVPMEKRSDGKIQAGYAIMVRDGVLNHLPINAPANHPYHGYRRTIDAASSALVIVKRACLEQVDIEALRDYHTSTYQVTDLIWQLKQQQQTTLYQAALYYQSESHSTSSGNGCGGSENGYDEDRKQFYQRWQKVLPPQIAPFNSHLQELLNPQRQPTVLIIDATLLMYDEDSGSLRLYTLLKIWLSLGYRLTFMPDNLDSNFKYRHALEKLGIEVFHGEYGIQAALAYRQFDFAFICRVDVGHRYLPLVRLLSPNTVIFYDTVDIHYVREQRQAEIENNPELAIKAQITKRKELSNCLLANRVITVTDDDGLHLQKELPNLEYAVLPNVHVLSPLPDTSFAERDGLVFIGNYNHHPNEDAVYYFVDNVLPKIHARLRSLSLSNGTEVKLYLIGSHMKDKMKTLASDHIKIIGWVDEVEPAFAQRRVFISYLRYGAGMKGKLGQALSLGLPVVTTTIGAEGMGLQEGETALIADDPEQFAEAVCRLYTDTELWTKLSHQGREYIEQRYGYQAVKQQLQRLLNDH